jgi:hypothetical protein
MPKYVPVTPCQIFAGKQKLPALPLVPVKTEAPFQQWGLDFIGEINPHSSAQHKWILTATDYFTKWVEAIPTKRATDSVVIDFLEDNILSRFGCPRKIVTDNAQAFQIHGYDRLLPEVQYRSRPFHCLLPSGKWASRII